jgi:pimeloyl-ACP methyl ester carboxylesterase
LQRIGTYLGQPVQFESQQAGIDYLQHISPSFGPHTPEQWRALSAPMLRQQGGHWVLHYDPAIAVPFKAMTGESAQAAAQAGQAMLWQLYDAITAPTLLLRGAQSDLLTPDTAQAMTQRGPHAKLVVFNGVGHAPTLVAPTQVQVVQQFLFST